MILPALAQKMSKGRLFARNKKRMWNGMGCAYIFGPRKPDSQETAISHERLEEIRLITKRICEDHDIAFDADAAIPTLNGEPIKSGDVARAFDLAFQSSLTLDEIAENFKDVDAFSEIMEGLQEALSHEQSAADTAHDGCY